MKKTIEEITKEYNRLMADNGCEHNEIGTALSQWTQEWTLRDMVAECDYLRSTFYEGGHCNSDLREDNPKAWSKMTRRLKKFIKENEAEAMTLECREGHASKYDL